MRRSDQLAAAAPAEARRLTVDQSPARGCHWHGGKRRRSRREPLFESRGSDALHRRHWDPGPRPVVQRCVLIRIVILCLNLLFVARLFMESVHVTTGWLAFRLNFTMIAKCESHFPALLGVYTFVQALTTVLRARCGGNWCTTVGSWPLISRAMPLAPVACICCTHPTWPMLRRAWKQYPR